MSIKQRIARPLARTLLPRIPLISPTSHSHGMASSAPTIPADLPARIAEQYKSAIASGSAFFYPSEIHTITDPEDDDSKVPLQWSVRRYEALREKAKQKQQKEEAEKAEGDSNSSKEETAKSGGQNPADVFAPPYDQQLLIAELGDHTLLLNKFALIPEHFLLVTREFRSQTLPPPPPTLALAFQILTSLPKATGSNDFLCFFNCGPVSGASQPHCHLQFVDLKDGGGVLIEKLLDRIQRDGKEMETIHALPLPYQHFVHLLPPWLSNSSPSDIEATLAKTLLHLLDAMFTAQSASTSSSLSPEDATSISSSSSSAAAAAATTTAHNGRPSYNLLLTSRAMHLIPREMEEYPLDVEGPPHEEIGPLSLNALCFAGHLVTKSNEEVERIKTLPGGVQKILTKVGRGPVLDCTVAATGTEGNSML